MKPEVDVNIVSHWIHVYYGMECKLSDLHGERDKNYLVSNSNKYVFKIAHKKDFSYILFQNNILANLKELPVQRIIKGLDGEMLYEVGDYIIRMFEYIEGHVYAEINPKSIDIIKNIGRLAARLDIQLKKYKLPDNLEIDMQWDLKNAMHITDKYIEFTRNQDLLKYFINLYTSLDKSNFKEQLIHNDFNDYNIIIDDKTSIIDFGDVIYSHRVNEIAIACAYLILERKNPIEIASHLISSYHEINPLDIEEIDSLFILIAMRLVVSVCISAFQSKQYPENEYLKISEKPAWDMLYILRDIHPRYASYSFRIKCEIELPFKKQLTNLNKLNIIKKFDLSNHKILDQSIESHHSKIERGNFIGRYDEVRYNLITEDNKFETEEGFEWKANHIAMDLYFEKEENIYLPIDVIILSYDDTCLILNYKGLFYIVIKNIYPINSIKSGDKIKSGEILGITISNFPCQIQIFLDLLDQIPPTNVHYFDIWRDLSVDPGILFGITSQAKQYKLDELLGSRVLLLGGSLSIAYHKKLIILRGHMQYLIDHTGRKYLDAVNNVPHVGHANSRVSEASQQIEILNTNTRYLNPIILSYAKRLTSLLPVKLTRCFFVNSGSEANELAIRLARTFSNRDDIIVLDSAYHGNTNYLIDISPYKFDGPGGKGVKDFVHKVPTPNVFRGQHQTGEAYADYFDPIVKDFEIAAFICESLPGVGGQIILPDNYLKNAYEKVRDSGGLCIADEVQVGFGRLGNYFWGFEQQGVVPDIVVLGKPIANGHPMGAVICSDEIANTFNNGMEFFSTTGGNPVSCAIGLAVLDEIEKRHLQSNAKVVGSYFLSKLRKLNYSIIGEVRGMGLFIGIELIGKNLSSAVEEAEYIINRMRDYGILISSDGPHHNVLKIKPPMVFNTENVDYFVKTLDMILQEDFVNINQ